MEKLIIHPSSVGTWLKCPMQWYFRNVRGIKVKPSGAQSLGTSVHAGLETNFLQKIKSRKDLPVGDVLDAFSDEWKERSREVDWKKEEQDKEKSGRVGVAVLKKYHVVRAPLVQPRLVEEPVSGCINGVTIEGTLDLVDEAGVLEDHKTSGKKVSSVDGAYGIQASIYKALAKTKITAVKITYLIKSESAPDVITLRVPTNMGRTAAVVLDGMKKSIEQGIFIPNPNGWWCSEKWCGYHKKAGGPCKYGQ